MLLGGDWRVSMRRGLTPLLLQRRSVVVSIVSTQLNSCNWSQRQIATHLGCSLTQVQRWLSGVDNIPLSDVFSLPKTQARAILAKCLSALEEQQTTPQQLRDRLVVLAGRLTESIAANDTHKTDQYSAEATVYLKAA